MYNIAKKYLLLGLSLSLLIVVAVFFFNQKETTAPQIEIAAKKQTKLTHIKYEGAVVVAEELYNIDDIIVELDAIQTAGTFSLTAMAQSITEEALKAFSDTDEYSLPLLSHWNVGIPELTDAMNPMYMIGRIEQGEHILVSWKLDPYYADTIGSSYYEESIKKAAELQLPLVFILPAPESALTKDSYYKNLSIEDNPNVIDENNNTLDKLSPFGPDERWNEVGNQWSSTTLMNQLQEWYPNPPLVVFVSEDEAVKLSWNEVSIASRYWECYSECSPEMQDDNYKRILLGGKWIEKYRQMQNGFREGFTESAWKDNVKFISYNNFSDDFGKSADWIDNATVTNQYVNLWPLTADGTTINFDLTGTKSDTTANSPHILANNLPFMLKEAKSENQNPNFAYQLSIDDDSKIIDPTQYRGLTQFALWFLRPNFIRQKSSGTIRTELEPMFKEVVDSVELIHYNPQVAEFWKNGELVQNGDSYLNENIPEQYQNDPRWFLLDADVNPLKPWSDDANIKVWAFALVKGEAPNREWLIYTQSPEADVNDVSISISSDENVLLNSSKDGSFYILSENDTPLEIISKAEEETTLPEIVSEETTLPEIGFEETPLPEIAFNVLNYGLVGDGVTDDTVAMKTMAANTGITNWYFPVGYTFRLQNISVGSHVKAIYGGGTINTIQYTAGDGYPYGAITVSGATVDLVIDGLNFYNEGRTGSPYNGQITLLANNTQINTQIRNCTFDSNDAYADIIKAYGRVTGKKDGLYVYKNTFNNVQDFALEMFETTNPRDVNGLDDGFNDLYIFDNVFTAKSGSSRIVSLAGIRFNTQMYNNTINGGRLGVEMHATNNVHVYENSFLNMSNGDIIMIGGSQSGVVLGENESFHNNRITTLSGQTTTQFLIYDGSLAEIYENHVEAKLSIEDRNGCTECGKLGRIHHNIFERNTGGQVIDIDAVTSGQIDNNKVYATDDCHKPITSIDSHADLSMSDNELYDPSGPICLEVYGASPTLSNNQCTLDYSGDIQFTFY